VRAGLLIALLAAEPTFEWSGASVCPGAEVELAEALHAYLGESSKRPEDVVVALRIEPGPDSGARLDLAIASRVGEERHELIGLSCAQVIDQAALLIASVIDPFVFGWPMPPREPNERRMAIAVRPPVQRPRDQAVGVEAPPSSSSVAVPVRSVDLQYFAPPDASRTYELVAVPEDQGDRPQTTGALGVAATAFAGLFPQIGGGAEIEGAVERAAFRWQITGSGWFGGRFRSSDAEVGGDLWALGVGSGLCGVPATGRHFTRHPKGRLRVPLCAVGGVGFVSAEAVGTRVPRRTYEPWAWAGAEARVVLLARPKLGIGLGVGVHAALLRPAWAVRSPDVEYRVPPVSGVLRLTVELRGLQSQKTRRAP
jgi:hypothetical protein